MFYGIPLVFLLYLCKTAYHIRQHKSRIKDACKVNKNAVSHSEGDDVASSFPHPFHCVIGYETLA